jgi:RNA polymerase sigma factor (sigma-70 family)
MGHHAAAEPKPSLVERLFTEQRGALQTFFLRRIRAKADAADLAQEVYVRMLRISDQDAIRNPVHYLYTVANNLVKENAVLDRRQASAIDIDEAPAHEQLETLPEFGGELDARQRIARLGVVLKQLRPKCRAAVELRFTHGLSFREIAMHLGVSPQMAKKYVAQGLSHCRRRMAQLG